MNLELKMAIGILRAVDSGTLDTRSMAADAMFCWAAQQAREAGYKGHAVTWLREQEQKIK
jgi:hypothetical protein